MDSVQVLSVHGFRARCTEQNGPAPNARRRNNPMHAATGFMSPLANLTQYQAMQRGTPHKLEFQERPRADPAICMAGSFVSGYDWEKLLSRSPCLPRSLRAFPCRHLEMPPSCSHRAVCRAGLIRLLRWHEPAYRCSFLLEHVLDRLVTTYS